MKYLTQQQIDKIDFQLTNSTCILLSNFLSAGELLPYLDTAEFITYDLNSLDNYFELVIPTFLLLVLAAEEE